MEKLAGDVSGFRVSEVLPTQLIHFLCVRLGELSFFLGGGGLMIGYSALYRMTDWSLFTPFHLPLRASSVYKRNSSASPVSLDNNTNARKLKGM